MSTSRTEVSVILNEGMDNLFLIILTDGTDIVDSKYATLSEYKSFYDNSRDNQFTWCLHFDYWNFNRISRNYEIMIEGCRYIIKLEYLGNGQYSYTSKNNNKFSGLHGYVEALNDSFTHTA